jgi:DNA-binding response OmpR family regulator
MDATSMASRVLLVEDEALISELVCEALADHGFEVHAVATASEALKHLSAGSPCDLLFTDINLPGGMDGDALAQLARELRPNLPVVYASGSVSRIEQVKAVPGAAFLAKPYDLRKLCAVVDAFAQPAERVMTR